MENLVPLGTGNSRLMKSNIPSNTTLAQLIQMWNNGTFPYDIGPLNSAGISQQGTPLNKDTLLKDTTAALYGLDNTAVPDDVLALLSRFNSGLGNEYVWDKATVKTSVTTESVAYSAPIYSETTEVKKLFYSDDFEVKSDGYIHLINPDYIEVSPSTISTATLNSILANKCVTYWNYIGYTYGDAIYRVASSPEAAMTSNQITVKVVERYIDPTINVEHVSYVNSPDKSSYPPAEPDEYTYTLLGQLGNKVQMATGSYVGTGKYGRSNPNTLTFEFEPKFIIISSDRGGVYIDFYFWGSIGFNGANNYAAENIVSISNYTLTWYHPSDVSGQLNASGITYNYLAIG